MSSVWREHSSFIRPSVDARLGGFCVLAVVNRAATNAHVQVFVWICVCISLGLQVFNSPAAPPCLAGFLVTRVAGCRGSGLRVSLVQGNEPFKGITVCLMLALACARGLSSSRGAVLMPSTQRGN